jgi:vacuole membrane protein 1
VIEASTTRAELKRMKNEADGTVP